MVAMKRDESVRGVAPNDEFRGALSRLFGEWRRSSARGAAAFVLCAALAAFSMLLAAGRVFGGMRFFPLASFIAFWGVVAAAASVMLARQLLPIRSHRWLAGELDRRLGGGNLISAALEFSKGGERVKSYSPFLLAATVRRAGERLGSLDPRRLFSAAGRPAWAAAGTVLGILVALQIAFLGTDPGALVASLADPAASFRFPYRYNLVVISGDRSVLPGESVTAEAMNFGSMHGDATLLVSTIPGVWNRIGVTGARLPGGEIPGGGGAAITVYRHVFGDVRDDFTYSFSAPGIRTPDYRVTVIHRPVINSITAVLRYPRYTAAKPDTLEPLAGKIVALAGTRVELEGLSSKPVRDGWIRFASGAKTPLRIAPGGFGAAFTVIANDTFSVEVIDSLGFANDHAIRYPIAALADRPPAIELLAPEDGAQLPRTLTVDLVYRGSDDYGIAGLRLFFKRDGKDDDFKAVPIALPAVRALTELDGRFSWSIEDSDVFPGDRILYYLEIADNNAATGPLTARTDTRRLLVPSISEIYARIQEGESQRHEDLEGVLEESRAMRERLKKLSDELKAEGDLDWARRRESDRIIDKQRELQEKLRDIAGRMDESLETIEKNRTASQEVGRKIEEIRNLLMQIDNEDLRSAIEKLQNLMKDVPNRDLASAMNDVELDMDKIIENMDRTIELLKQAIKEENMEALVRRLDDMLKEQSAIRDSTVQGGEEEFSERRNELSKQQDELGAESKEYEKDFRDFAEQEGDSALAARLDSMIAEMERAKASEDMKQAAEQLSQGEREGAERAQENAIDDMLGLYTSLTSCQMSMGLAMERQITEMLSSSTRELVEASKLQESIMPKLFASGGRWSTGELIDEELVVKTAVRNISNRLYEAARKTMSLSPGVFMSLGLARKEIETALDAIEEERSADAVQASARAYRAMNVAAIELLRSSVASGSSGASAREKLQQMLRRQLSLRQELQRLLGRAQAGRLSMQERAGMARLAAEQRKMEELMRQIAEESRGTHDLLGKLDDIAGKMEDIARDLDEGKLDRELIDRQEHILTRLLDSQRSMRERDYKKERSSTAAGDVKALAPDTWREEIGNEEVLLRMIRRAMQEKGPTEYEELIRQYFRALSERLREAK
jgi:hypothetical protein